MVASSPPHHHHHLFEDLEFHPGVPHAQLIQGLHNLREHSKGKDHNTKTSHEPKRAEFLEFCDKVYGFLPFGQKPQVCPDKAIRYMMYAAFREQKKRGEKRDSSDNSKDKFVTRGSSIKLLHW